MSLYAADIYQKRLETLKSLNNIASTLHQKICASEHLSLEYKSFIPPEELFGLKREEIAQLFEKALENSYKEERARGMTIIGPHRDDFEILINSVAARRFASQGQQKSAALSLKLAELELIFAVKGEYPVLLLDDVMSELDEARRDSLLSLMDYKAQLFITATDLNFALDGGKVLLIAEGKIIEQH
jgi:DNA replication and repair protein RecF